MIIVVVIWVIRQVFEAIPVKNFKNEPLQNGVLINSFYEIRKELFNFFQTFVKDVHLVYLNVNQNATDCETRLQVNLVNNRRLRLREVVSFDLVE